MNEELWEWLQPSLRLILELELNAGNAIEGWGESDWSVGRVLLVRLAKPLARRYEEFEDVVFRFQDPHYFGDNISTLDGKQGLITPLVPPDHQQKSPR